jgi:hypothetical protein
MACRDQGPTAAVGIGRCPLPNKSEREPIVGVDARNPSRAATHSSMTFALVTTRKRKPLHRRLAGHGRLGWGLDKAARSNSIDAVVTLVAVSSSKPANGLASLGPAEVRTPSSRR